MARSREAHCRWKSAKSHQSSNPLSEVLLCCPAMKPTFFPTPADLRAWLEAHHERGEELLVGFYKRGSGRPSITWPESVDEALCFGWIDGVRRSLDAASYTIRFTPRRPRSIWSAINTRRIQELEVMGRVRPAGLAAFARRKEDRSGVYSHEQRDTARLDEERPGPLVPAGGDPLGHDGQARGDAAQAPRRAHRRFGARVHDPAADPPGGGLQEAGGQRAAAAWPGRWELSARGRE